MKSVQRDSMNDRTSQATGMAHATGMVAVASDRRRRGAIWMSLIALASIYRLRSNGESVGILTCEFIAVAGVMLGLWLYATKTKRDLFSGFTRTRFAIAAGVTLLPWLANLICRYLDRGAGVEIVMLTSLANLALALPVTAKFGRHISLSVVTSGFLTLFATAISDQAAAVGFAALWTLVCLWWLVANHWERLETCPVSRVQHDRWLRHSTVVGGLLLAVLAGYAVFGRTGEPTKLLYELMPTSGGKSWSDPAARSGVGNGEALVAAKDHAMTFGPVETDLFMESPEPSLFDMYSDTFGEPFKRQRHEKAIAKSPQGEVNQAKMARSHSAAAAFTTRREQSRLAKELESIRTPAIFQWIGRTGISLPMERFTEFDGEAWSNGESEPPAYALLEHTVGNRVWYQKRIDNNDSVFDGTYAEALKVLRFRDPRIAAPSGMLMWHLHEVNRADFFAFDASNVLFMPGRAQVPTETIVRLIDRGIDYEKLLRRCEELPLDTREEHPALTAEGSELLKRWTHGLAKGWPQVSAVIQHLRSDFNFTRKKSDLAEDLSTVAAFFKQRGGDDVMFATVAALMLRELGYTTRFVTGIYVNPERFNAMHGQTDVLAEDTHAWIELSVGEDQWIPLEPTPGYREPSYELSWSYRLKQAAWPLFITGLACGAGLCVAWYFRAYCFELICLFGWTVAVRVNDRRRIQWLVRVLDTRMKLIGSPRPLAVAPKAFWQTVANDKPSLSQSAQRLFEEADRLWFGRQTRLSEEGRAAARVLWLQATGPALQKKQHAKVH